MRSTFGHHAGAVLGCALLGLLLVGCGEPRPLRTRPAAQALAGEWGVFTGSDGGRAAHVHLRADGTFSATDLARFDITSFRVYTRSGAGRWELDRWEGAWRVVFTFGDGASETYGLYGPEPLCLLLRLGDPDGPEAVIYRKAG